MNQPIVRSNPVALVTALLSRGLTVTGGAQLCGLDRVTFDAAIKTAKPVTVKTAAKLKAAFGDDVVTLVNPKQRELDQLIAMRAEFADKYPGDKARLETLDAMIRDAREHMKGSVES